MERRLIPLGTKTIMSIWSFKRKRYPDGTLNKHKARLCAHGGMQTWGQNYWETYAPVVNWTSVRVLFAVSKIPITKKVWTILRPEFGQYAYLLSDLLTP